MKTKKTPKLVRITTVPISLEKLISGQMKFMSRNGFDVVMVSSPSNRSHLLEQQEESIFISLPMTRTISPVKDLISLCKLIFLLRNLKPDIVHSHTPKAGMLGMIASYITSVPIRLHTVAGLPLMEAKGIKRRILEIVEKLTYVAATRIYPNSKSLAEFILRSKFCKPEKIRVLGNGSSNGIDTEFFKASGELSTIVVRLRRELQILSSDFVFVFVGRIVKDKGIHELISAFKRISVTNKQAKLILVGPTEPKLDPLSAECAEEIEINENILTVGYQSDVRPYLLMSNALVFPSYREGFPNVPMQAGCFELPSIVSDINGCNEIIVNEMNGLIVPAKDSALLFDAMNRILCDTSLYLQMKSNARAMIVSRYEQKIIWALILDEYQGQLITHKNV